MIHTVTIPQHMCAYADVTHKICWTQKVPVDTWFEFNPSNVALTFLVMMMVAFTVNYCRQGLVGIRHDFYVWNLTRQAKRAAMNARARHAKSIARY
jgi:uncharacterized paraquat-inducible protein A